MKKKDIKWLLALCIPALLSAGCAKQLDQANPNQQTSQTFWKTQDDAVRGVNAVYGSLIIDGSYMRFTPIITDTRGDGVTSNSPWNEIYNCGKFNEDVAGFAASAPWTAYYQGVLRANQVLEYVPPIKMDTALKDRILGQAYFLRGFFFFMLGDIYANVPVPLSVAQSSKDYYSPQLPQDSVWLQSISDLKKAADLLPVSYQNVTGPDQGQLGRATKGAALAFLGKVYLFRKQYPQAAAALKSVIDLKIYGLMPNYADNFTAADENNKESVFEVQFSNSVGGTAQGWGGDPAPNWQKGSGQAITYAARGFGFTDVQPTTTLLKAYQVETTTDGLPDPRLQATLIYNHPGETVYGRSFQSVYGAGDQEVFCKKYTNDGSIDNENTWIFDSPINYRVMRYADVLLMYAESLNDQDQTAAAYPYIDAVRTRAHLPALQTIAPGMTRQQMQDTIAHERFLEFALEGKRFDDIRRWGWLQDPDKLAWLKSRDPEFNSYVPGREYMPIPQAEIDANPKVKQNAGYR